MRKHLLTASAIVLGTTSMSSLAFAQTDDAEPTEAIVSEVADEEDEENRQDLVLVTGTRMQIADPSARIDVITDDDIERRGLATAEDVIRSLPQNLSSVNSSNSLNSSFDSQSKDVFLGETGVGIATANLRGLGSSNTLILVNGKRVAGIPGQESFVANLRDFPASAIERVEVNFDGGSAIYGSDAVAGVINIITKRGFTGGQLSARYENSSTGGDLENYSGYFGRNWNTGSLSVNASYSDQDAVESAEAGFTMMDYRSVYPDYSDADQRNSLRLRSGGVAPVETWFFGPQLLLPLGNDGTNATVDDFQAFDENTDIVDVVDPSLTPSSEEVAINVFVEQEVFSGFKLRGDFSYSLAESTFSEARGALVGTYIVPETNAFNPFGEEVYVYYNASQELEDGLIPPVENTSESELRTGAVGFDYQVLENLLWVADYTKSVSERTAVKNGVLRATRTSNIQDEDQLARVRAALASSDPNTAINVFGDGTAQNQSFADVYGATTSTDGSSKSEQLVSFLEAQVLSLPGGDLNIVLGGEWRKEALTGDVQEAIFQNTVENPERDIFAAFGEVFIPILGEGNATPFAKSVSVKLDARYDEYEYTGVSDTDDTTGDPIEEDISFSRVSPRVGVSWKPVDDLLLRTSWSQGFKVPDFSHLFSATGDFEAPVVVDPLSGELVFGIPIVFGPNPGVKPQISETVNLGLRWSPSHLSGLDLEVNYSNIEIEDRITTRGELFSLLPTEVLGNLEQFYQRDEEGTLVSFSDRPINLSNSRSETLGLNVSYAFDNAWGRFEPSLIVDYVISKTDKALPESDTVSNVGDSDGVDRYRARATLLWDKDAWSGLIDVNHIPAYNNVQFSSDDNDFITLTRASARTTVDASLAYTFDSGLTFRGGARNLFDAEFPSGIFPGSRPFDATRVDTRGRVAFIEATYDFSRLFN